MTDTLGTKIRHLREEIGYTQADLANAAGITQSQVCLLEQGTREPRIGLLQRVATALGVTVGEIVDG